MPNIPAANRGPLKQKAQKRAIDARPSQAVPGNNTPAAVNGDAHPTNPTGGSEITSSALNIPNGRSRTLLAHKRPNGMARSKDDVSQSVADSIHVTFAPKKAFAPGNKGHVDPM